MSYTQKSDILVTRRSGGLRVVIILLTVKSSQLGISYERCYQLPVESRARDADEDDAHRR